MSATLKRRTNAGARKVSSAGWGHKMLRRLLASRRVPKLRRRTGPWPVARKVKTGHGPVLFRQTSARQARVRCDPPVCDMPEGRRRGQRPGNASADGVAAGNV